MKKNSSNFILGLLIVIIGIIYAGNAISIWDIDVFFNGWWTLFLIIPALSSILEKGFNKGNCILLIIGGLLLLNECRLPYFHLLGQLIFPIIIILIGISIMDPKIKRKVKMKNQGFNSNSHDGSNDYPDYVSVFSGGDYKNVSLDLKGVSATAVFGGIKIDLRDAVIRQDIVINVTSIFGGVEILAPKGVVVVEGSGVPIFGAFSNSVYENYDGSAFKIIINHTTAFGATEVK